MQEGRHIISFEEYLADPCPIPSLSRSTIKDLVSKTPRHAFWNHPKLNKEFKPEESEKKFDIGTAAHSVFLQVKTLPYVLTLTIGEKRTHRPQGMTQEQAD